MHTYDPKYVLFTYNLKIFDFCYLEPSCQLITDIKLQIWRYECRLKLGIYFYVKCGYVWLDLKACNFDFL